MMAHDVDCHRRLEYSKAAEMEHRYSLPSQITIRVKDWTDVDIY
jgi:hypothetical protein